MRYFDRRIDLYFYDKDGNKLTSFCTPNTGCKPDITVKTTKLGLGVKISTEIAITNFNPSFSVESIEYIGADMYYGNAHIFGSLRNQRSSLAVDYSLYRVLDTNITRNPPDKKIVFNCCEAYLDTSLWSAKWQYNATVDEKGFSKLATLKQVLNSVVSAFNKFVQSKYSMSPLIRKLLLNGVEFIDCPEAANETLSPPKNIMSVYDGMYYVRRSILTDEGKEKYGITCQSNKIIVYKAHHIGERVGLISQSIVPLDFVLAATRTGNVVSISTMFDPRLLPYTRCSIPNALLTSKKGSVGQKIMPLDLSSFSIFYIVDGMKITFGTVRENTMTFQGVIENTENT